MAALIRWMPGAFAAPRSAFAEMARLRREMDRLLESGFRERPFAPEAGVFPPLNLSEDDAAVYVRAELPGVSVDDLELYTHDDKLIIKGERRIAAEPGNVNYHRREREAGTFQRILSLPVHVSSEGISAAFTDGVLTIKLAKAPEAKPRKISVTSA